MNTGMFETAIGALPTIIVAYVLEERYLYPDGPPTVLHRILSWVVVLASSCGFTVAVMGLTNDAPSPWMRTLVGNCLTVAFGSLIGKVIVRYLCEPLASPPSDSVAEVLGEGEAEVIRATTRGPQP